MIDTLFTGQAVKRVFLCPDPASIRLIPHCRITTVLLGGAAAANSVGKVKAQQAFPVFCSGLASRISPQTNRPEGLLFSTGAFDQIRTGDPHLTTVVLYQLSYKGAI